MYATALGVLGSGPDAEDAVQDAMVMAMTRIGDVRNPGSVGSWLRTVARNQAKAYVRARRPDVPLQERDGYLAASETPESVLERTTTADWVRAGIDSLSEPLRLVTLLRYFSPVNTYSEIATLCGLPVGTVRSRLHAARGQLVTALAEAADQPHPDTSARSAEWRAGFTTLLEAAENDALTGQLGRHWRQDALVVAPDGDQYRGWSELVSGMRADLDAGVRQRPGNVVAGQGLAVVEAELLSPADDPEHCPPHVVWLFTTRSGWVDGVRLFHPAS